MLCRFQIFRCFIQTMKSLTVKIFVSDGYCQMFLIHPLNLVQTPESKSRYFLKKNTFLFFNLIYFFVMVLNNQPLIFGPILWCHWNRIANKNTHNSQLLSDSSWLLLTETYRTQVNGIIKAEWTEDLSWSDQQMTQFIITTATQGGPSISKLQKMRNSFISHEINRSILIS